MNLFEGVKELWSDFQSNWQDWNTSRVHYFIGEFNKKLTEFENETDNSSFAKQLAANRYAKINDVVTQMGGWANFLHWIKYHATNDFQTCDILKKKLEKAIEQRNKHITQVAGYEGNWFIDDCAAEEAKMIANDDKELEEIK